eukprot:6480979-Amphidinium_carterae.1
MSKLQLGTEIDYSMCAPSLLESHHSTVLVACHNIDCLVEHRLNNRFNVECIVLIYWEREQNGARPATCDICTNHEEGAPLLDIHPVNFSALKSQLFVLVGFSTLQPVRGSFEERIVEMEAKSSPSGCLGAP